jgi:hypothetical protein
VPCFACRQLAGLLPSERAAAGAQWQRVLSHVQQTLARGLELLGKCAAVAEHDAKQAAEFVARAGTFWDGELSAFCWFRFSFVLRAASWC